MSLKAAASTCLTTLALRPTRVCPPRHYCRRCRFIFKRDLHSCVGLSESPGLFPFPCVQDSRQVHLRNHSKCTGKMDHVSLRSMFGLLDADFFSDAKMLEIEKGARELNLPIIKLNRELAASVNGGLESPSCLVFSSSWNHDCAQNATTRFSYPSLSGIERPKSDEDIAFMSLSC